MKPLFYCIPELTFLGTLSRFKKMVALGHEQFKETEKDKKERQNKKENA